jgi:hypothetical protein
MPASPRQATARTRTNGQGCAVAAAPARFRASSSPISRRLPPKSERTVVGSTLPCQSRVGAAPTADGASCLAGPGRTGPGQGRSIHPLQETDRRQLPMTGTGVMPHSRTAVRYGLTYSAGDHRCHAERVDLRAASVAGRQALSAPLVRPQGHQLEPGTPLGGCGTLVCAWSGAAIDECGEAVEQALQPELEQVLQIEIVVGSGEAFEDGEAARLHD